MEKGVERPVEGGFSGSVVAVNEKVAASQVEDEFAEGFEVSYLDFVKAGLHTEPPSLITPRRSGLSADIRIRRLRNFDEGALSVR